MRSFLHVAAALAAMSESTGGGGGPGDPRDELARLREENARLRGERPPTDAERAAEEQALRGRAEPETDESRQMRAEERGRKGGEQRTRLRGDDATRELIRIVQGNVQFHYAGAEAAQRELDELRVGLGDEELGAHIALRDHQRALANHNAYPATPAGNLAHAAEVEKATKALEANPLAKRRLEAIEKARRTGAPVDFTAETEGGSR